MVHIRLSQFHSRMRIFKPPYWEFIYLAYSIIFNSFGIRYVLTLDSCMQGWVVHIRLSRGHEAAASGWCDLRVKWNKVWESMSRSGHIPLSSHDWCSLYCKTSQAAKKASNKRTWSVHGRIKSLKKRQWTHKSVKKASMKAQKAWKKRERSVKSVARLGIARRA